MNPSIQPALLPAKVLLRPKCADYLAPHRKWQGVPSMEITANGLCYVSFYTGGNTEESGNYVIVIRGRKKSPKNE